MRRSVNVESTVEQAARKKRIGKSPGKMVKGIGWKPLKTEMSEIPDFVMPDVKGLEARHRAQGTKLIKAKPKQIV
jgi:hypothetical protein